jgi:hypothetical protein
MDFGTANGPACWRCTCTVWSYDFDGKGGTARCVSCGVVEGPLRLRAGGVVLPVPTTAVEARKMHEDFLKEVG